MPASATMAYIFDTFRPGVGIRPEIDWEQGVEGVDYIDLTDSHDIWRDLIGQLLDVATDIGFPGTQILMLLPLVAGALIIPLKWIVLGIEVSLFDIIFILWLTWLMPMPSVGIFGLSVPLPMGAIWYYVSKDVNFPIFGDGIGFTLPHTDTPTYFSGQTDGKFTWKDFYLDAFIFYTLYKIGRYGGSNAVALMVRVFIWAAQYRMAHVTDVLERIKDPDVNLSYSTGYGLQENEKTMGEVLGYTAEDEDSIFELLDNVDKEIETESDTGIKAKEYIKRIRGHRRL